MALEKQLIPVNFDNKLDTKTDPKIGGGFSRVENMFRKRSGEYRKRYGFDQLPSTVYSGDTAIADDIYVSDFNKELVAITSNDIYSYSESDDKWKEISDDFKLWSMDSIKTSIGRNYYNAQIAVSAKYYIVVTSNLTSLGNYETRYTIYDVITNSVIKAEVTLHALSLVPQVRLINNGTYFIILYIDTSSDIKIKSIKQLDFSEINQTITGTFKAFDAICDATNLYIYANDNTACKLYRYNSNTLASVTSISAGTTTSVRTPMRITYNGTNIVAYYCDYVPNVIPPVGKKIPYIGYYQQDLTQINAITAMMVIDDCFEHEMENFSGFISPNGSFFTVNTSFLDTVIIDTNPYYSGIFSEQWILAANTSNGYNISTGLKTIGQAFYLGTKIYQMVCQNISTSIPGYQFYQDKCFLLNMTDVFSFNYLIEGVISVGNFFSGLNNNSQANYSSPITYNNEIYFPSIETVDGTLKIVSIKKIYQDITTLSMPTKTNNDLIIPGLLPLTYTGDELIEVNYSQYPWIISSTTTGAGVGIATGKTYQYAIVASHIDRNGIKRRSAVSPIHTQIKGDAFIWRMLFCGTIYNKNIQNLEIYRTTGDGTIFYYVATVEEYNAISFFDDTIPDSTIVTNEILYTTGGVLDVELPSSASIVKIMKNRLFMAGCESPDRVYYSKELAANFAPEMSPINSIEFFDNEGAIIGLGQIDDKIFFFKKDAIFYVVGELNDDLGQNASFSMNKIPGNIGLTDNQAIVEFSNGIIFKSARGFYLLDRGLGVTYIGQSVEYFNTVNITSSVLMSDINQIRFTSASGTCLVYDYFYEEWYIYTNILATSATNWEGSFVFAKSNGTFFKENPASWLDVSTAITSKIQTGWLSFAGIQGFQRIYKGLILGEYRGTHTLKIAVGTNFNPYFDEQITVSTSTLTGSVTNDASYYSDYSTGSTDSVYQFKFKPMNQKCESMRFLIEDAFTVGNEGFTISAITLEVGAKKGLAKLTQAKNMT